MQEIYISQEENWPIIMKRGIRLLPVKLLLMFWTARARLFLRGLTNVSYHGEGIFWVQQGFSQGLMNDRGEWICQEPLPEED